MRIRKNDQLYDDKDKGVKEIYKALLKLNPLFKRAPIR